MHRHGCLQIIHSLPEAISSPIRTATAVPQGETGMHCREYHEVSWCDLQLIDCGMGEVPTQQTGTETGWKRKAHMVNLCLPLCPCALLLLRFS